LPRIGVLAIQGDVAEHLRAIAAAGGVGSRVRRPADLALVDGLILPGGESTTIGMLGREAGLLATIRERLAGGMPAWGTCAGLILLAREVGREQPLIGGLDVAVARNAFGRQVDSFEVDLDIAGLAGGPFRAVFIRAPVVSAAGPGVAVLARLNDGTIVAVRQGPLLGTSFHPELTGDPRLHALFVDMVAASIRQTTPL
jgi:5'-phosphate synthase pdxT subunit